MWNPFQTRIRANRPAPHRRLLRDLLLLLGVTCGSLLAAVFYIGESLRDDLAQDQLRELAYGTSAKFSDFFLPAEKALRMAAGWGAAGALDVEDAAALTARFIPVLVNMPRATALVLGDTDGRSYYLARDGEAWVSRTLDGNGQGNWQLWAADGSPLTEHTGRMDFDPRTRPWFRGALETTGEQIFWTRPYLFHTARIPGVTGSASFRRADRPQRRYVLGLDLPLTSIIQALAALRVGERGQAFLTETDGSVLLPHATGDSDGDFPVTLSARGFEAGPVFDAVRAWLAADTPAAEPLSLHSGDQSWWAWLQPVGQRERGLWLGITLPEADFLGALRSGWYLVVLAGVLVLAAGLVLTLALTRR